MTEVTFWSYLADENISHEIVNTLRKLMHVFYNMQDYEVLIVKASSLHLNEVYSFEQEFTQNVAIIECDEITKESAQDVMFEYANGLSFLEIDCGFSFDEHTFDKLLYDANICDEDNFKYLRDKYTYILLGDGDKSFLYDKRYEHKCLTDYKDSAGSIDAHYFYQDIYVASKVKQLGITHIYDIGSRVEGYISHLLSMDISVTMIDVRYLDAGIDLLKFVQGNATELSGIDDSSLEYLSCLHALEHFGLGRYGDPLDFYGWKKALKQYKRVIKRNGLLFLSVPVGKNELVMFNAHRIFRPFTIVNELYPDMRLLEFACIHDAKITTIDFNNSGQFERIRTVLEEYSDNKLGDYDCGIFIFERC
jgi:hypothetical protein